MSHERRWRLRRPYAAQERIANFPPIVGTALASRGITTRPQADLFYKPHLAPRHELRLLPGIATALERVKRAIDDGEKIALFGDFDVDGVTSIAVLKTGLERLGAKTRPYIPERFSEGYGLNTGAVEKLAGEGCTLIITADCGTSSVAEVARGNTLGMDTIIIDHHSVPEELPAATAVVNPKRPDSEYPFDEMAAVGVCFRFVEAVHELFGQPFEEGAYLDLAAMGTVIDVAPLVDENRAMVTAGLEQMNKALRPGVEALTRIAGVQPWAIDAGTFGFKFGPRMNAAGRLDHAQLALDLLLAETLREALPLAEQLEALNQRRREQCDAAFEEALELCGASDEPLIMVGSPRMHAGIVGIVAARLAERWHRPAIVFEEGQRTSRASARSIDGFDIVGAIRKEKGLLLKHGGHRAAAGFTIENDQIPLFRERVVNHAAEMLQSIELRPVIDIDAETPMQELRGKEIKGLMRFEPCGQGNPKPVLLSRDVEVLNWRPVGQDGDHLQLRLRDGALVYRAIAFGHGKQPEAARVDIVYSLQRDRRGENVELEVLDLAPSEARKRVEMTV